MARVTVEDCLEKLREMLAEAAIRPVVRKVSKPTRGMIERRLKHKREVSRKKNDRGFKNFGGED